MAKKKATKKAGAEEAPAVRSPEDEIAAELEGHTAVLQERIEELKHQPQEYPKWVNGVVVENAEQEKAVKDGTAQIEEIVSAQGNTRRVK